MVYKHDNDKRFKKKYFVNKNSKSVLILIYSDENDDIAFKFKDYFYEKYNILMLHVDIYKSLLNIQNITNKDEIRKILTHISIIWEDMKKFFFNAYQYGVIAIDHGCWPGMQIIMRRHECRIFAAINPDLSYDDYLFFTPAPCTGIVLYKNDSDYDNLKILYNKMVFKNCNRNIALFKQSNSYNQVINFFEQNITKVFDLNNKQ